MKRKMRILGLLIAICVTVCSLNSCSWLNFWNYLIEIEDDSQKNDEQSTVADTEAGGELSEDEKAEEDTLDAEYTLSEADLTAFEVLLKNCEEAFLNSESTEEQLTELEKKFSDAYYHIVTQSQIAYVCYCLDMQNEKGASDYLFSSQAATDCYDAYMQMCKRIDVSTSPWKSRFFEGWTAEQLEEMRGFSQEITQLNKENDQILVDYRNLTSEEFYQGAADYYVRLVANNNRIAQLKGFENYWEYANEKVYDRDYGKTEVEQMRQYVKTYIVPLCEDALNAFQMQFSLLTPVEQSLVIDLLAEADYDGLSTDFVGGYLTTFDDETEAVMKGMLEPGNSYFTDYANAYQGAFTIYFYEQERPVCFFGPGYQSVNTVIHELGHYYAYTVSGSNDTPMDLSEVQSQGNEWLFVSYLNTALSENTAKAVYAYHLYQSLCTVIIATMVDEFEQCCYESGLASWEQADAVMAVLKEAYGGADWLENYATDMDVYWRYVTVEQSVYYVSYAVSMLAAIQIYVVAETQSYESGMETYLALMDGSDTFLECLAEVGLKTPMDEALYLELLQLI